MFGFKSSKQAEEEKIAFGKAEYYRGAKDAAEALKAKEDEVRVQKNIILDDWATLKIAKKELDKDRAQIILEGIKEIFTGIKNNKISIDSVSN